METILIVDDDPAFRTTVETILEGDGYQAHCAPSVAEAIDFGQQHKCDLVLSAMRLPDGDGMSILRWWRDHAPDTPVVMTAGAGSLRAAVEAMKHGATDYLGKPLSCPEELGLIVEKLLEQSRIANERDWLREEEGRRFCSQHVLTDDPKMTALAELVQKVAPTGATVLITGETGTGKEVLARTIHMSSLRADHVFIRMNCAAAPPALLEVELFGRERAAFNGGAAQHIGRLERAHGGTLFLDEIGALDANLQTRLLRLLQERSFQRVGGSQEIAADVRLIAATDRDLPKLVAEGRFREELYYRLNMFPLDVPPLREHSGDIPNLARTFLARAAKRLKRPIPELTPEAEAALVGYSWPANIKELENVMERAAILADAKVTRELLPLPSADSNEPVRFRDIERQAIQRSLKRNNGNRTRTARELGISLRTLQYRLKEYAQEGLHF